MRGQAFGGIGVVVEVDEGGEGKMAGGVDLALQFGGHGFVKPARSARRHIGRVVFIEGHVVLEIGSVGDVIVDKKVGQPAMKHLQEGARLGRVGLLVVAVEVDVGAVAAPSGQFRPVLVDAVVGGAAFVAIDVVNGDEDEDDVIQQRGAGLGDDDVPEQRQARILAVHFSGVDGVLHQENGAAGGVNGGGSKTPSLEAMTILRSRPSPVLPKFSMRTWPGAAAAMRSRYATVSA